MTIKLYTPAEESSIVKNAILACKHIHKLNARTYKFISLCSGFIAHYNHSGFIAEYSVSNLKAELLHNQRYNQWSNFREGESNYEYYMQKKHMYNAICLGLQNSSKYIG